MPRDAFQEAQAYTGGTGRLPFAVPDTVVVQEVGPRDGLQLEGIPIPTADKVALVDALSRTGLPRIQVTSFVRPDAVPQMADGREVMQGITRVEGVEYAVLIPNLKGAERALETGATCWETMLSTTDGHSLANANRTTAEAFERLVPLLEMAVDQPQVRVVGGLATALGCPFDGRPSYDRVAWVVGRYVDHGVRHVTIADTAGLADPAAVYDICSRLRSDFDDLRITLHLHNTRGLGLANVLAGLAAGVQDFDSSIGGLGGCPFAPGATGNIATEELVHLLHLLGIRTGVDLDALITLARTRVSPLVDHPLESAFDRADPSWRLFDPSTRQHLAAQPSGGTS